MTWNGTHAVTYGGVTLEYSKEIVAHCRQCGKTTTGDPGYAMDCPKYGCKTPSDTKSRLSRRRGWVCPETDHYAGMDSDYLEFYVQAIINESDLHQHIADYHIPIEELETCSECGGWGYCPNCESTGNIRITA